MEVLGADAVRTWRYRVPQVVIAFALPLTAVGFIAASWNDPSSPESIRDVVSLETMTVYVGECLFALSGLLGWLRPRFGMCVLTGSLLILAPVYGSPVERAIEVFWISLLVTDLLLARRQTALARAWPRAERRSLEPEPMVSLSRRNPWVSGVVSVLMFVLALGLVGLWLVERDHLVDLDERAVSQNAEVTELDTAFDFIDFRLDGKEFETQVEDASTYEVGETITVRTDPAGQFGPLGPEDFDPRWTLFWGPLSAPLLLVALHIWVTPRFRHRDRKRAFADAQPIRVLVSPAQHGSHRRFRRIELQAGSGLPFARARRVSTYNDTSRPEPSTFGADDTAHEAWVHGVTRFGRTAVVEMPDLGILLVPTVGLRDPFTIRAGFRRLFRRS